MAIGISAVVVAASVRLELVGAVKDIRYKVLWIGKIAKHKGTVGQGYCGTFPLSEFRFQN